MSVPELSCEAVRPLLQLLTEWSLARYLRTKPPSTVVTVSELWTVGRALEVFAAKDILSAPIFDSSETRCVGFLDLADILEAVLQWFNLANLPQVALQDALQKAGQKLSTEQVWNLRPANDGQLIYRAHANSSLLEVITKGFLRGRAGQQAYHRVAVFDFQQSQSLGAEDDDDEEQDIRVTSVISQSDIIRFVHHHADEFGPLASQTVEQLGLATRSVVCVSTDMPTINAFAAMTASHVSSAGLVSSTGHGVLEGILSVSDLRGIRPEQLATLALSASCFLASQGQGCRHSRWSRLQQVALQTASTCNSCSSTAWGIKPGDEESAIRVATCRPETTFLELLSSVVGQRLHSIYVVDDARRPVGVITLTDILRMIGKLAEVE